MEGSTKVEKVKAMKKYKRAQFLYNFVLYSLTSLITCFFFSYPFWFPSMTKHLLFSLQDKIYYLLDAKFFFVLGNLIVLALIREWKLAQSSHSSPASDMYDEYVARSRGYRKSTISPVHIKGEEPCLDLEERTQEGKKGCKNIMNDVQRVKSETLKVSKSMSDLQGHNKRETLKGCKTMKKHLQESKRETLMGCKNMHHLQESKRATLMGCKSLHDLQEIKGETLKGCKSMHDLQESKKETVKGCNTMNHLQESKRETLMGCKSMHDLQESQRQTLKVCKRIQHLQESNRETLKGCKSMSDLQNHEKKTEMRVCKVDGWDENENLMRRKPKGEIVKKEGEMPREELNKRVEAFIARVNKQRCLEAKMVDHIASSTG